MSFLDFLRPQPQIDLAKVLKELIALQSQIDQLNRYVAPHSKQLGELSNVTEGLLNTDQSILSLLNKAIDRVTALEQGAPGIDLSGVYDQLELINERLQHQGDTIAVLTRLSDEVAALKAKADPMVAILQGLTEMNKKLENRIAALEGGEANVTREELDQFKAWIVQQFEGGE